MLVVGGILLLLVLLAFLPLAVRLVYEENFCLYVYIWKLRIRLLPRKKKRERVRSYSTRARERRKKREQRRAARRERQLAKKRTESPKQPAKKRGKKRTLQQTTSFVKELGSLVLELLLKFSRYAKLRIARLIVIIGTGDAAETAKLYGVSQIAVTNILAVLDEFSTTKISEQEVVVRADFLAETSTIGCDVQLQLRVWQIVVLGAKALFGFLRCRTPGKKKKTV